MSGTLGEIRAFAGNYAPQDWALCDGTALSINNYPALYALLGTTYGSPSAGTFSLPDLRGRVLVSVGKAPVTNTIYTLGAQGGSEYISLLAPNMPAHTHTFTLSTQDANTPNALNNYYGVFKDVGTTAYPIKAYLPNNSSDTSQALVAMNASVVSVSGQSTPHENRQPYIPLTYIICVQGLYPSFP